MDKTYEEIIYEEQEHYRKIRFLMFVFQYKHTYLVSRVTQAGVTIEDLYAFVICDKPLTKRNEFYNMFNTEKYADTFWTRFVDNYYKKYIRKEIENEKSILQK